MTTTKLHESVERMLKDDPEAQIYTARELYQIMTEVEVLKDELDQVALKLDCFCELLGVSPLSINVRTQMQEMAMQIRKDLE